MVCVEVTSTWGRPQRTLSFSLDQHGISQSLTSLVPGDRSDAIWEGMAKVLSSLLTEGYALLLLIRLSTW